MRSEKIRISKQSKVLQCRSCNTPWLSCQAMYSLPKLSFQWDRYATKKKSQSSRGWQMCLDYVFPHPFFHLLLVQCFSSPLMEKCVKCSLKRRQKKCILGSSQALKQLFSLIKTNIQEDKQQLDLQMVAVLGVCFSPSIMAVHPPSRTECNHSG